MCVCVCVFESLIFRTSTTLRESGRETRTQTHTQRERENEDMIRLRSSVSLQTLYNHTVLSNVHHVWSIGITLEADHER